VKTAFKQEKAPLPQTFHLFYRSTDKRQVLWTFAAIIVWFQLRFPSKCQNIID